MKKIICWLFGHKWRNDIRTSDWIAENTEQIFEVFDKCRRCKKESIKRYLVVQDKNNVYWKENK